MKDFIINSLVIVIVLCVIGYINTIYKNIRMQFEDSAVFFANNKPSIFYIITPLLFWILSHAFMFKNSNGPLMFNIVTLFDNLQNPILFKSLVPFTSLIMIFVGSLISVYAGGTLGYEAVVVNISVILLLYVIDFFRTYCNILNIEGLLYIGYISGFTLTFRSPMSSFILAIEKLIMNQSQNIITNIIYSCVGISFSYLFIDSKKIFPDVVPKEFDYNINIILKYGLFSLITGSFTCILFNLMYKSYFMIKNLHTNNYILFNIIPILSGLCVALIINNSGSVVIQSTEAINDMLSGNYVYTIENTINHILNIIFTFISGCSGGLLVPSLTIGSCFAFIYNKITSLPLVHTLIIGMTSVFSAFLGYPITSAFIVKTILNQNIDILPILILCAYISYFSYKYINKIIF